MGSGSCLKREGKMLENILLGHHSNWPHQPLDRSVKKTLQIKPTSVDFPSTSHLQKSGYISPILNSLLTFKTYIVKRTFYSTTEVIGTADLNKRSICNLFLLTLWAFYGQLLKLTLPFVSTLVLLQRALDFTR